MPFVTLNGKKKKLILRKKKRTVLSKLQKKSVAQIARNVAMSLPEKKVFGFQSENNQLFHNKAYYSPDWLKCKQGVGDPNDLADQIVRIGDEIYLRNINISYWFRGFV